MSTRVARVSRRTENGRILSSAGWFASGTLTLAGDMRAYQGRDQDTSLTKGSAGRVGDVEQLSGALLGPLASAVVAGGGGG